MDPLRKIDEVCALILQEEQQLGIISSSQLPQFESTVLSNGSEISALSISGLSLIRKIDLYASIVVSWTSN